MVGGVDTLVQPSVARASFIGARGPSVGSGRALVLGLANLNGRSRGRPRSDSGTCGHAISTTQPGPGTIVNRKPCNRVIAATRFRPRPRPDACLVRSDR